MLADRHTDTHTRKHYSTLLPDVATSLLSAGIYLAKKSIYCQTGSAKMDPQLSNMI